MGCRAASYVEVLTPPRSHDQHARPRRLPHGPVLWQLWYHGHLQLAWDGQPGQGGDAGGGVDHVARRRHDVTYRAGGRGERIAKSELAWDGMGWDSDRGSGVERNLYDKTGDGKKRESERESERGRGQKNQ